MPASTPHIEKLQAELDEARWQLRIEASLDRLRRQVSKMSSSSELLDIVTSMSEEFSGLGLETLQITNCRLMTDHYMVSATNVGGSTTSFEHKWPFDGNPIETGLRVWLANDDPIVVFEYSPELAAEHMLFLETRTDFFKLDPASLSETKEHIEAQGFFMIFARTSRGAITNITWNQPSQKSLDVLVKFAGAFDQAYARFEDLQKAEAQAREAQIEASLERVRARAMAMQNSDDIGASILRLFKEIPALCPDVMRLGLAVMGDTTGMNVWLAGKDSDGNETLIDGNTISRDARPEIADMISAWERGESFSFKESEDFLRWARDAIYNDPNLTVIPIDPNMDQYLSAFAHKRGLLFVIAERPFSPSDKVGEVIQRFTGVFELAYQRFYDLKQAEQDYSALLLEKARTEDALSELQSTQAQLIEQEKLASLGALTAGIAHEIKNPLNFVNNFAEVSGELSEEIVEALDAGNLDEARQLAGELTSNSEQIAKHGRRADSIVKSMMQHARGGVSEMETIELNTYLEEYINLAWHGMRARDDGFSAEVSRDFDAAVGSITAMPQELGRVILNLLNNAFDAVRETENATITVSTRALGNDGSENNAVEITISDNGPGIPDDIREKIFEPFFTTKPTGEGTGLGLSLSHDIVTKGHGGSMTVRESESGGACFVIQLPKSHS